LSTTSGSRPAWSDAFDPAHLKRLPAIAPLDSSTIDAQWAWGGSTGARVKVAVIESGIDADHPAVGDVNGYVAIGIDSDDSLTFDDSPHGDAYGHGTACAGIIRSLAPDCELYSVRVLGEDLTGRGAVFAAGLRWAIEHEMQVCNLSLSTGRSEFFGLFHELADAAYFRGIPLVCAANNAPRPSYPSLFASVFSVAAHEGRDPEHFDVNPLPPVEFGAPGLDVEVAWSNGSTITATGNSFAAPHITGIVARVLGKHPSLTVYQLKTILRALAANVDARPAEEATSIATAGGAEPEVCGSAQLKSDPGCNSGAG
jgi:subtilisin